MAKRHSILSNKLGTQVVIAAEQTKALHFADAEIDPEVVHQTVVGPVIKLIQQTIDHLPEGAAEALDVTMKDVYFVNVPLPHMTCNYNTRSFHNERGARLGCSATMLTQGMWNHCYHGDFTGDRPHTAMRFMSLPMYHQEKVPMKWQWHSTDENAQSSPGACFWVTPDHGELYSELQRVAERLEPIYRTLNYMARFAAAVTDLCTTPGITVRMWPEAPKLLQGKYPGWAEELKKHKPSPFPKYAKQQLVDEVTPAFMHRQLEAITNMALAAQLMPDREHYHVLHQHQYEKGKAAWNDTHVYFDYCRLKDVPKSILKHHNILLAE